jgi:hypothetical protein
VLACGETVVSNDVVIADAIDVVGLKVQMGRDRDTIFFVNFSVRECVWMQTVRTIGSKWGVLKNKEDASG